MRIIRISRPPALEAALARFDAWWGSRSRREQWLLIVMAVLLGGAVLVYGVVKPLQAARAQAVADIFTYETLSARIRAAGSLTPGRAPQRTGSPDSIVTGSAVSAGITATTQPIPNGVRATVADGTYEAVLAWLADIGSTSRLAVRRVAIQRRPAPGRVSATVDFESGARS
jgi:general secretion pathway protein M